MVKTGRKKPRKNAMSQVLELLENKYVFATPDDIEVLYLYKDGVYIPGETTVKAAVEEIRGDDTDTSFCNEVINHFKRRSYTPRTAFNHFKGEIPVLNGLLNLETMQLRDFDPKKIFTYKINTRFHPDKDCPQFKAALNQILPKEDEQALLQEYAGYTLWPEFPHHKFIVFIGVGRNGKGVIIRTIVGILGQDNVSNIRLEHLDGSHRFMVPNLFGKLMNVCSEPSTRRPFKTELLKQITGQDTLDGEIKGKQNPLRFIPFTKFFVQANKLPVVDDTTLSFWDRINIIEFTETFTDEKGNKTAEIESMWLCDEDERSGILNWMIEGLKRLKEKGQFTQTKSMDQQILKFKQASDPVGAFLTDPQECMYGANQWVTRNDLYNAYKEYAETIGTKIETTGVFAERIKRLPGVKTRQKRVKGTTERIWTGISIRKKETALEDYEEEKTPEHESEADEADETPFSLRENENNNNIKGGDIPASPASPASFYPLRQETPKPGLTQDTPRDTIDPDKLRIGEIAALIAKNSGKHTTDNIAYRFNGISRQVLDKLLARAAEVGLVYVDTEGRWFKR
ncbi:MAG: phage/plasmid primase, P4 family [Candidatus Bathyarchaeota archaeon]